MNKISKLILPICFTVILRSYGQEADLANTAERIFTEGDERVCELITPKVGYAGAPPSTAARASALVPATDKDFDKHIIRISVVQKRKKENGLRIILRLDEIDRMGNMAREGGYFAYIDVYNVGARVICKYEDDNGDSEEIGIRYGIPFPLTCTRPPALGFIKGTYDGAEGRRGRGVVYEKKEASKGSQVLNIEATYFDRGKLEETLNNSSKSICWHGPEKSKEIKEQSGIKKLWRETQKWGSANDWLWTRMERYDANGNIMMRCKEIKLGKDGEYIPVDTAVTNAAKTNEIMSISHPSTNSLMK